MTDEEKIDRGMQAAALIDHPMIREALQTVMDNCTQRFINADPSNIDEMRDARLLYQAAEDFAQVFVDAVMEGRNAASQAEHEPMEII